MSSVNLCSVPTQKQLEEPELPMALPLRVPWTGPEEFEEVFGLLFASSGNIAAQQRGVDRVRFALIELHEVNLYRLTIRLDPSLAVKRILSRCGRGNGGPRRGHSARCEVRRSCRQRT